MSGRRILITGGSQGIGLAIARGLLAAGDDVAVLSRRPPPNSGGPAPTHLPCDLRSPATVETVMRDWLDSIDGTVDGFIHSAVAYGSTGRHPFLETSLDEWNDALDVNARGLMLVLTYVLAPMLDRRAGTILGVSSDIATLPGPGRIPYAASKAAAHAVLIGLAAELTDSESSVHVVELMPTVQVDTPGIRSRRASDFEPVGYAAAECFVAPTRWLLDGNAGAFHGTCLLVERDGRLRTEAGEVLT